MYCRYSLTLSEGEARHYAGGWACLNGCPTPHLEDVQRVGPEEHGYKQEPNGPLLVARRAVQDVPRRGRGGEGEGWKGVGCRGEWRIKLRDLGGKQRGVLTHSHQCISTGECI